MAPALPAAGVQLLDVREAQLRESVQAHSSGAGADRPLRLWIGAGVVQHVLVLGPNHSLGSWSRSPDAGGTAFEGELPGMPGSWARVTRTPSGWVGLWSDGARHFALDTAGHLAGMHPDAARLPPATPMVYALADARIVDGGFDGDIETPAIDGERLLQSIGAGSGAGDPPMAEATLPTKRLSVALVADAELVALDGAATTSNLLARLNVVDGIFASQVGVRIAAGSTTLLSASTQPFSSTDPSTLLGQLRNYRSGDATQQAAGLSHLMTGRNLDERTVGIAYIEGLCSNRFGASLSEARSGISFDALIAAHEIAHVFGAPHDGEGACASAPSDRLMATQINGSSTFSACSLGQMAPVIARATCLAPVDAADAVLGAPLTARVALGQATALQVTVRSEGTAAVEDVELQVELPRSSGISATGTVQGGAPCAREGLLLRCSLGTLATGTNRAVDLSLLAAHGGFPRMTLRLSASNDALPGNNSGWVDLEVVDGADLALSITADPASLAAGGATTATITMRNLGHHSAPRSTVTVSVPAGVTATGATPAGLACTAAGATVSCEPLDLAPGDSASVALALRGDAPGSPVLTASASSARFDPQPANNQASAALTVAGSANASAPGGGGGGSSPGLLLLLGLLCCRLLAGALRTQPGAGSR